MITITVLSANRNPFGEGIPFQLVSNNPQVVLGSARTDRNGKLTFNVDATRVRNVALRLDAAASGVAKGG